MKAAGIRYIDLVNEVMAPLPPLPIAEMGLPPWTPLPSPLEEATVMMVSSAGIHFVRTRPSLLSMTSAFGASPPALPLR